LGAVFYFINRLDLPENPFPYGDRSDYHPFISALTIILILLLVVSTLILLYRWFKYQRLFIPAIIFTLVLSCLQAYKNTQSYPGLQGYTKDGHRYLIRWWTGSHSEETTKYLRWKSVKPYEGVTPREENIDWILDSSYEKR
jgi:hypothetical protein